MASSLPRSILSVVLGVLAVATLVGGGIGLWSMRVLTDTDRFETRVESILQDPQISEALATYVVDEVATAVDLQALIDDNVPSFLQGPVELIISGIRREAEVRLASYVESDEGSATIAAAAGVVHRRVIAVLEGDSAIDGVTTEGDEIRVNLLPVVSRAMREIQDLGILTNLDIPTFDRGGDPDEQRQQLADALGVTLPAEFGTPVIYSGPNVSEGSQLVTTAQDAFVLAKRAVWLLLIGGVITAVLSVLLARRKVLTVVVISTATFVLFLAVQLLAQRAAADAIDVVREGAGRTALQDLLDDLVQSLSRTIGVYAVVLVVAVILSIVVLRRSGRDDVSGERTRDDAGLAAG
jgi:hypothetical protein